MPPDPIRLFSLSTCSHCKAVKKRLERSAIAYESIEVDLLSGEDRRAAVEELRALNSRLSLPTLVAGGRVIVGNRPGPIEEVIEKHKATP